jgi:predicted GNAT family N-acyltransferase
MDANASHFVHASPEAVEPRPLLQPETEFLPRYTRTLQTTELTGDAMRAMGDGDATSLVSGIATTDQQYQMAFRLRYQVYIAEQKKCYVDANHAEMKLTDGLDNSASILMVTSGSEVRGTVRANWFDCPEVRATYAVSNHLVAFSDIPANQIAICSRLAVDPQHRGGAVSASLFAELYKLGLRKQTKLCFQNCRAPLIGFFTRCGFRQYLPPVSDPVAGSLHPMVLALHDLVHFARAGSPLLQLASFYGVTHCDYPWLEEMITSYQDSL